MDDETVAAWSALTREKPCCAPTDEAQSLAQVMRQAADEWLSEIGTIERSADGKRDAYVVMAEAALVWMAE
ncbi:hypothetical protein HNO88_000301 [Novosphingobium chloroacetimidivorans]|uniref:Uncharacterized protein n=1 Tax=Novosphingobium chloroacetimidivorans TaxID=1428314 RepID=A0A7W7K778_9SPHN|nr:hypothetical protein [Novosphingobium chloroacetimidivorans]MBB4857004.1 hypothetical protein [Novosphingobium chloroacetimidivorans]